MDLSARVRALPAEHADLRANAAQIGAALRNREAPQRVLAPWAHLERAFDRHLVAEERDLLEALSNPDASDTIERLRLEHDEMRTIEDALRSVAPESGLETELLDFLDRLAEHLQKADEVMRALGPGEVIRRTRGHCNECLGEVPAAVVKRGQDLFLEKTCAEHGVTRQLLSHAADHWAALDRFYFQVNSEEYPQRDYIVRMTERCNLDCPICLAKANTEDTPDLDLEGLEKLLSERRGIKIDLMAAEPTLREDLEDWIRRVKESGNIAALHTNGLKLANRAYAERIKAAGVDEVFLQFDGFDDDAHEVLRGRRLLKARLAAMKNLRELGIATSLIVVIARGLNEAEVAKTFDFALQPNNAHIREVFFLGLRVLGSARYAIKEGNQPAFAGMAMMPDELVDLLTAQKPRITRSDVLRFNKLYFSLLSAFRVKKCLYVQHYLVLRDGKGGYTPISELLDLRAVERVVDRYAEMVQRHPRAARAWLMARLPIVFANRKTAAAALDFLRLQLLFKTGMNLSEVPQRFLLLGFITACDPQNFDAAVAVNCGKGELSVDGGYVQSGAVANVRREARFDATDRRPGRAWTKRRDRTAPPTAIPEFDNNEAFRAVER